MGLVVVLQAYATMVLMMLLAWIVEAQMLLVLVLMLLLAWIVEAQVVQPVSSVHEVLEAHLYEELQHVSSHAQGDAAPFVGSQH